MPRDVLATCPEELKERHRSKVENIHQRSKAIRLKCLECCCWNEGEVRNCQIFDCALHGLGGQPKLTKGENDA